VSDLAQKLDVLAQERDTLRLQVTELRKSLEDIQEKHTQDTLDLRTRAETAEQEKEEADQRYNDLRDRVTDIRATLGERLKSNAVGFMFLLLLYG
jgi:predicted  nucleic acid-binding Zn-ribbon protein